MPRIFKGRHIYFKYARPGHFILVLDGIEQKLRNKELELRKNIIENSTNHEVRQCFK